MDARAYQADERVKLTVGGGEFKDFTSIWVQRTWGNAYDQFKFTCAERDGASAGEVQASSKFKPGDKCEIELAGQKVIKGIILSRQLSYDANSRGVQLQGTSDTWAPATSSVKHKTNNFKQMTFEEIVDEVLTPTHTTARFKGKIPKTKFEFCRSQKGETNFAFLERLSRDVKVIMTCNKDGEFLFIGEDGKSDAGPQGELIEGKNILKMQCVDSIEQAYKTIKASGQTNALEGKDKDKKLYWKKASEQQKEEQGPSPLEYRHLELVVEQPTIHKTGDNSIERRAINEAMWQQGAQRNATIVVYGWQPAGTGKLWEPGSDVTVKSPMAMIDEKMMIQSVTYTQDNNSGTLSTLVCVSPNALNGPKATK